MHLKLAWSACKRKASEVALTPFVPFLLANLCDLLVHESGHLRTQFIGKDARTYLKGKYTSVSGKLIFTALK